MDERLIDDPEEAAKPFGSMDEKLVDDSEEDAVYKASQKSNERTCLASPVCGTLSFMLNVALLFVIGHLLIHLQANRVFTDWRDHDYKMLLVAACPRCALLEYPPQGALPHAASDWAMWALVPTMQCFKDRGVFVDKDEPGGYRILLGLVLVPLFIQDIMYYYRFFKLVMNGLVSSAVKLIVLYVLKHGLAWGLVLLYWKVFPVYVQGCHNPVLVLAMLLIFSASFMTSCKICESNRSIDSAQEENEETQEAVFSSTSLFVTVLGTAMQWPYETFPLLSEFAPKAVLVYLVFMYLVSYCPWLVLIGNTFFIEQLVEHAVADLLLLESLRHKTGFWRYIAIRFTGGLTSQGGAKSAGTAGSEVDDDCRQKFYLFKDTFMGQELDASDYGQDGVDHAEEMSFESIMMLVLGGTQAMVLPNTHAWLTARNAFCVFFFHTPIQEMTDNSWATSFKIFLAGVWGTLVIALPSVKFRFALSGLAPQKFMNDPCYGGMAWYTQEDVPAWHIGPFGTCLNICTAPRSYCTQIPKYPKRVAEKVFSALVRLWLVFIWIKFVNVWKDPIVFFVLPYL